MRNLAGECYFELLQSADPIPQGSKVFVVERHKPNVFIKIDGLPQPNFRLFRTSGDARVAGEVESDYGTLGMQITRLEKD